MSKLHPTKAVSVRPAVLVPIEYVTLTDQVYRTLKEQILTQQIELGARVRDEELAEQLGVSRTPVREALRILIRDGLVETFPRSQTRVRTFTEHDLEEIFDIRIALESMAAKAAARHITPSEISRLRNAFDRSEAGLRAGDNRLSLEFDRDLHRVVLECCRNTRLQEIMATINDYVTLFRSIGAKKTVHPGFNYKHLEILSALERGDGVAASEAMAQHIEVAKSNTQHDFKQPSLVAGR